MDKIAEVSAEKIIECLFAEYQYWRDADIDASMGAIGAISNVIAFATTKDWRAGWHPQKDTTNRCGYCGKTEAAHKCHLPTIEEMSGLISN